MLVWIGVDIIILALCMLVWMVVMMAIENIQMYSCSSMSTTIDIVYVSMFVRMAVENICMVVVVCQ